LLRAKWGRQQWRKHSLVFKLQARTQQVSKLQPAFKEKIKRPGMMVQACNPSNYRGGDQENSRLRLAQGKC
jgi:hypothetical protein